MTENEKKIIDGLIIHDEKITKDFFNAQCRPLLSSVVREVFKKDIDFNEAVDGFHTFLVSDDSAVLRQFAGDENKSTLYKWLRITAKEYFIKRKKEAAMELHRWKSDRAEEKEGHTGFQKKKYKEIDIAAMLDMVELERDRFVLERIDIDGVSYNQLSAETGLSKVNLYNIRKRAIDRLKKKARIALSSTDAMYTLRCEQYAMDSFGIHKSLGEMKKAAETNKWLTEEGIAIKDLGKISQSYGLAVRTYKGTIDGIAMALASGRQVLVAVDCGELIGNPFEEKLEDLFIGGVPDQCVVVLGYDEEEKNVMLFNPAFGDIPLRVKLWVFLDAWEDSGNYTVEINNGNFS